MLSFTSKAALLAASALVFCACEVVDYIELKPSQVIFKQLDNQAWIEARCMARTGARAVKAQVSWSVRDPEIATVTNKGLVKPLKSGDTEVIARYGEIEARAPVSVILVEKVEVEPKTLTLVEGDAAAAVTVKGEAAAVKVKALGKDGRVITDRTLTMNTSDKAVAQIGGGNAIMPLDPGTATITVQVDGQKASLQVTVEADKKKPKK